MARISRRSLLAGVGGGSLALLLGGRLLLPSLLRPGPLLPLDGPTQRFVDGCFSGLQRERLWDVHAHLVGLGSDGSGCWVNPQLRSFWHPIKNAQFDVYFASAGVRDESSADREYLERLLALHAAANPHGKLVLLAFDKHVNEDGSENPEHSEFYTPNDYVLKVAREHASVEACASVHPYRKRAVAELERVARAGARAIKWLPNAMGIDPASPKCDGFYKALVEHKLTLLSHAGEEAAVDARDAQELGNPLRLRRALDLGVRVVMAHCASLGQAKDLEASDGHAEEAFDLFLRLMDRKEYENNLFADISALVQLNRCGRPLRTMLLEERLHKRLVNGSDYPLPAIDPLISTRRLVQLEYLSPEERALCNSVFEVNPLLFDFVVKRSLKVQDAGKTYRFPPETFETAWLYGEFPSAAPPVSPPENP